MNKSIEEKEKLILEIKKSLPMAILFISWTLGFSFLGFYKGQLVSYKDLHNDQVEHIKYEFVEPTSVDMKINDKELKESSKVDEKPSKSKRW